ncbi:MAG TPA: DUF58 domain-containing protein [Pirellulaceae bacterium]|nr:DUF58 domain-containing protein [Pirellulaceae bacterium]HMO91890.1 DUF58 domain-containing protein [Pirellulaceae bacterium]HMP68690.1 DUF58 domain-containing protein [Pirellulaceae bacterium]
MKWVAIGVLIWLIGFIFNLGVLVYAMYAVFALLLISRWLTARWTEQPSGKRVCSLLEAEIGSVVTVQIRVRNNGRFPITWALIDDVLPPEINLPTRSKLKLKGASATVARISAGQEIDFKYELTCIQRGYFQIGPLVFESGDVFGLFRKFRVLAEPHYLTVLPKTHFIEGYDIASRKPVGEIVMTHRLFEDPTRIAGIRQYQPGDPLSRINWRATARTNALQSKIYEPSSMAGATIVLDFHLASFPPQHEPYRSELAITAAASIANVVHEMHEQVGLISNGRDAVDRIKTEGWRGDHRTRNEAKKTAVMLSVSDRLRPTIVPTRKHPAQLEQIRHALARLELTDGMRLPQLLIESMSRLPRDAAVIVILGSVNLEFGVALGQLRRRGYAVTAILNTHDHEHFATMSGPLLAEGIETRMLIDVDSIRAICKRQLTRV